MKTLLAYEKEDGSIPFEEWIASLKEKKTQSRIDARLSRLALGNPGDHKPVEEGIVELRLHFGPGYRVYYVEEGNHIILLLFGGDKSKQIQDIQTAKDYYKDYRRRNT